MLAAGALLGLLLPAAIPAHAQEGTAVVDPTIQYQTFEGWGTSLAWWANVVGGFPEPARSDYMGKVFDPVQGLGLNVVRYNIGGGENPAYRAPNKPFLEFRAAMPGFEPERGKWDWTADANQRWVLENAVERGATQLEAFSNSPPYWMTESGSVTGNHGGQDNLKADEDTEFAEYLAAVCKHFQTNWHLTFRTIEPLNEPDGHWWNFSNHQEGCFVERPHQNAILKETAAAIQRIGLGGTHLAAPDSNTIADADKTAAILDTAAIRDLRKINTHSYGGGDRTELSNYALTHGLNLWLSEYGDGDGSGITMSQRILEDMNGLHPTAWVYWQMVDPAGGWGFLKSSLANETDTAYTINEKYYVMANYSRFIRPGYRLMAITDTNSLAAYDAGQRLLVIVTTNAADTARTTSFDLSQFTRLGPSATPYRTSATQNLATLPEIAIGATHRFSDLLPPKSVTTYVLHALYDGPAGIDYQSSFNLINAADTSAAAALPNGNVLSEPAVHSAEQRWGLIGLGNGVYKLVSRATGKLLDVPRELKDTGVRLIQYEDDGDPGEHWRLVPTGANGIYDLINASSGLALSVNSDRELTQESRGGSHAHWQLAPVR